MSDEETTKTTAENPNAGEGSMDAAAAYAISLRQTQEQQAAASLNGAGDTEAAQKIIAQRQAEAAAQEEATNDQIVRTSLADQERNATNHQLREASMNPLMGFMIVIQLIFAFFGKDLGLADQETVSDFSSALGLGRDGLNSTVDRVASGEITGIQAAYETIHRVGPNKVDYEALAGIPIDSSTRHKVAEAFDSDGAKALIGAAEALGVTDKNQQAYILATVYHETGGRMAPVRESFASSDEQAIRSLQNHANSGRAHGSYAANMREYSTPDGQTGEAYFGRGFVQITWAENYRKSGARITEALNGETEEGQRIEEFMASNGVSDELMSTIKSDPDWLYKNPDVMVDNAAVSAIVTVDGMKSGSFTGKSLDTYFNDTRNDPIDARRMINGDVGRNGTKIAGYHGAFLKDIESAPDSPATGNGNIQLAGLRIAPPMGENARMTSDFGPRNLSISPMHKGIDLVPGAGESNQIVAQQPMVFLHSSHENGFGHRAAFLLGHDDAGRPITAHYAHGASSVEQFEPGDVINPGEYVMTMGSSGRVTGAHLDWQVRVGDQVVDPEKAMQTDLSDSRNGNRLIAEARSVLGDRSYSGTYSAVMAPALARSQVQNGIQELNQANTLLAQRAAEEAQQVAATEKRPDSTYDQIPAATDPLARSDATPVASLTSAFGPPDAPQGTDQIAAASEQPPADTAPEELVAAASSTTSTSTMSRPT